MLNGGFNQGTTFLRRNCGEFLNSSCLICKGFIFNRSTEPVRIIATPEMIEPCGLIDSLSNLAKEDKILSAKIQSVFWAPKIKTAVRSEFPFGILPTVATAVSLPGCRPDSE